MDNILECDKKIFTRQIISCSKLYIYHSYIFTTVIYCSKLISFFEKQNVVKSTFADVVNK